MLYEIGPCSSGMLTYPKFGVPRGFPFIHLGEEEQFMVKVFYPRTQNLDKESKPHSYELVIKAQFHKAQKLYCLAEIGYQSKYYTVYIAATGTPLNSCLAKLYLLDSFKKLGPELPYHALDHSSMSLTSYFILVFFVCNFIQE